MSKNSKIRNLFGRKLGVIAIVFALFLFASCSGSQSSNEADDSGVSQTAQTQQETSANSSNDLDDIEDADGFDEADEEDALAGTSGDESSASSKDASSNGASSTKSNNGSGAKNSTSNKSSSIKNGVPSSLKGNWESQSGGLYYTSDAEPNFSTALKKKKDSFEDYSSLDYLGRCGPALACIGLDIMPTEGRGSISEIKPTGWRTYNYDFINGGYLYNRCHLIAFSLAGENANERNLITGTRQMNEAMIMFENIVYTYVTGSGNHCLYRVTPVFLGNELVARGVHMEAYSIEDNGSRVKFNVYLPNKQDRVSINYSTGESSLKSGSNSSKSNTSSKSGKTSSSNSSSISSSSTKSTKSDSSKETASTYVLNTSSKKFHYSSCSAVKMMADHNKSVVKESRSSIISRGYSPCGICHP